MEAVKVKFYCFLGIVHPTVYNTVGEPDYIATHIVLHNGTTHIVLASGVIKNTAEGGSFVWHLVY